MILADKIIKLRKKNGWSQEELADKLNVSRQAVSKWENASAIPALDKILQLCDLFGVTSDYLLKDEIENEEYTDEASELKKVSLDEANRYIAHRKRTAWRIAFATLLCILSPVTFLILSGATEIPDASVSEKLATIVGLVVQFALVLCAVPVFIYCGFKNTTYAFLEKCVPFELEYGVRGIILEKYKAFRNSYVLCNIIAACLCVISPVPLIVSAITENAFTVSVMLAVTIALAGVGAFIFIVAGIQNASLQKLLKEGDYTMAEKKKSSIREPIGFAFWSITVAVYLAWSLITNDWHITWIVFLIAGILFPALMAVCNIFIDRRHKDD